MENEIEANDVAGQQTSSHREERLVRPPWEDTCSCLRVAVTVSDRRHIETEEGYKARWRDTVKHAYEHGADWNYDADCPLCWCGTILRTNANSAGDPPTKTSTEANQ